MNARYICAITLLLLIFAAAGGAQTATGVIRGQVTDPSGAAIAGAAIELVNADGKSHSALTNEEGRYSIGGLAPARYTLRVSAPGFSPFEQTADIAAGTRTLDVPLTIAVERQVVEVEEQPAVSVDPSAAAGAVVLKGEDLESLPDNPEDLEADLQALAGPAAGPNGGQIFIDGFTGGRLPPKESIREIRINSNPFSAEYDRIGFGRIEIFTKPGADKFRGQAFFNFGDRAFNSRNPFSPDKPDYRSTFFGGNLSGPLTKKSSFFIDVERRDTDDNELIVASILDASLNPIPFATSLVTPEERTTIGPRIDYQLTPNHTLTARYTWSESNARNRGVGQFELPSRAYNSTRTEQTAQLTETAILGARGINEARFQFIRGRNRQQSSNFSATIDVQGAFTGGGAPFDLNFNNENRYEFQDNVSLIFGAHQFKFGGRLRGVTQQTQSTSNFAGTFTFGGSPNLPSIENYRQTELLLRQGLSMTAIHALGFGPTQFTIAGGQPLAGVDQFDAGLYAQDDWRIRPNLTMSAGLRYEGQSNIADKLDLAPRVGIAWAPGAAGGRPGRTVVRAGLGIFYDRFSEELTLNAIRLNGVMQQQFIVRDPDFYPDVPSLESLRESLVTRAVRRVDADLNTPYTVQWVVGVERQLPRNISVSVNYVNSRGFHVLRSRNINAPLAEGVRPYGSSSGDVYLYESTGFFKQHQLMTNVQARLNSRFTLFGFYVLGSARSDTDGAGSFPAHQYDLTSEYGRAAFDTRHRAFFGGNVGAPFGLNLSPFITMSSGRPFNITLGRDRNGDGLFTERPALATNLAAPGIVETPYGAFDINPGPGQPIIERNYGDGPGMFSVNLRLSRTFGWGERSGGAGGPSGSGGMRGMRGGRGGGPAFGGFRGGMFGSSAASSRYSLTFSVSARNLLNNVNLAPPVGQLSSPFFGQSIATAGGFGRDGGGSAGNRRVEMQLRFNF
jgi:hypothetical protein